MNRIRYIFWKNGQHFLERIVIPIRFFAEDCGSNKKGLVLGAYAGCKPGEYTFTNTTANFDEQIGGKLTQLLRGTVLKVGDVRVFKNTDNNFYAVAVAFLGSEGAGYSDSENLYMTNENIRIGAGLAARQLQMEGVTNIYMEEFSSSEASSEAGYLATWKYEDMKSKHNQTPRTKLDLYCGEDKDGWIKGKIKVEAQNFVRQLEETPSNLMTPLAFTQAAIDNLCPCGIQIEARDKDWIENKKMGAFLSITQGSCESPMFLEVSYCGSPNDDKPYILAGMGVTFDSGGLCLKSSHNMSENRGALAGAAVTLGVIKAAAQLALPINIIGMIPLCENMPSGIATRPGDVVTSMNGKTIRIENTDNEGVAILADVLFYSSHFHEPCFLIDIGNYTNGTRKALGAGFSPVFSTSDTFWREMMRAGAETGDRFWRLPFWKYFKRQVTDYQAVDINNKGKGNGGHTCLAAAFLKEFTPSCMDFVHIDISGTGLVGVDDYQPYLRKGVMTGRPTRSLIQLLYQLACPHHKQE